MTFNAASRLRSLEDRSAALGSRRCELPGMHSVPTSAVLPYASGVGGLSRRLLNICEVSSTGLHVNGTATETSDARLKEDIKEINCKTCYDIVKYIKPKEFNVIGKEETEIGFIAQDIHNSKMPKHWSKMVMKDTDDEYLRLNYIKMNVVLWGAVQEMMKEITHLKAEITKLKGKGKGEGK